MKQNGGVEMNENRYANATDSKGGVETEEDLYEDTTDSRGGLKMEEDLYEDTTDDRGGLKMEEDLYEDTANVKSGAEVEEDIYEEVVVQLNNTNVIINNSLEKATFCCLSVFPLFYCLCTLTQEFYSVPKDPCFQSCIATQNGNIIIRLSEQQRPISVFRIHE